MGEKRAYKARKSGGGRKKLKPEYDAGKNLKDQMDAAVALYKEDCSLQSIADVLNLNPIKVRKLLITAGVYESEVAEKVQDTFERYRKTQDYKTSILSTATVLGLSKASVTSYLPYKKGVYLLYFYCKFCHVSVSEKDLWNGIHKELRQRMEEHKNLKKLIQKNSGKSSLEAKKAALNREMEQMAGNIVRLESQKRSGYEQYVLGKLSKEKFLELKQGLENEIVEQKQEKSTKEKEFALIQEELQQKKQTVGSTEVRLTADNLQQYVKKIEVDRRKITCTEFVF